MNIQVIVLSTSSRTNKGFLIAVGLLGHPTTSHGCEIKWTAIHEARLTMDRDRDRYQDKLGTSLVLVFPPL